ncbi:holo-ACP synthase [Streptomyces albidoflavus]|nr:holo-ACP synthase [Streptomyces albidoflavus]
MQPDDEGAREWRRGPGGSGRFPWPLRLRARHPRLAPPRIVGVGIDVAAIARFGLALERSPGLRDRLFTPEEQMLPSGSPRTTASLAARFAAKEAVAKVLGAPGGLRWHDVGVRTGARGRPVLQVCGTVAAAAARQGISVWHLSLTHDGDVASAVVVGAA